MNADDEVVMDALLKTLRSISGTIPTEDPSYSSLQAQIDQWVATIKGAGYDDFEAGMVMMIFLTSAMQTIESNKMKAVLKIPDFMTTAVNDSMREKLLKAVAVGLRLHA